MLSLHSKAIAMSLLIAAVGCDESSDGDGSTTADASSGAASASSGSTSTTGSTATSMTDSTATSTTDSTATATATATATSTSTSRTDSTGSTGSPTSNATANDESSTTAEVDCLGIAEYSITFEATWDDASVRNRHFSGLIGGVHTVDQGFWRAGELASPGVQTMAETGASGTLGAELEALIEEGSLYSGLEGPGIGASPGSATATFSVENAAEAISITTMIAPSPDWFAGLDAVSLCEGGEWLRALSLPAPIFDAGTDSGPDFTSPNEPTEPAVPIAAHPTLLDVGTWVIQRTD